MKINKKVFAKGDRKLVVFFLLAFLVSNIMAIFLPFSISIFIDDVLPAMDGRLLWNWAIMFISLYFVYHIYNALVAEYLRLKFETKIAKTFMDNFFTAIMQTPFRIFSRLDGGSIFNIFLNDSSTVTSVTLNYIIQVSAYSIGIFTALVFIFLISPVVAIVYLLSIPIFILLTIAFRSKLARFQEKGLSKMDILISETQNIFNNKRSVELSKSDSYFFNRYEKSIKSWFKYHLKYWFYITISEESPKFMASILRIIIFLICGFSFMDGRITLGEIVFISTVSSVLLTNIEQSMFHILRRTSNKVAFERVENLYNLNTQAEASEYVKIGNQTKIKNANVDFGNSFKMRIDEIDFPSRGIVLIEGENGAGKSTILNLLKGFINPKSLAPGAEISITKNQHSKISYLSSPIILAKDSVLNNILLDNKKSENFDKILECLKIEELLEKQVSIAPPNLSYGEVQKIALSRILNQDFEILFLDEPFVNLDKDTSLLLAEYLKKLSESKLIFIISHEINLKNNADMILKVKDGAVTVL